METTTQSLTEFVRAHAISFSVKPADSNPNMAQDDWHASATHWLCVLRRHGARMTVPFSQGSAHTKPPTVEDVLDCLASDCAGYENARGFLDWCAEYGYSDDSRRAERTYKLIGRQAASLKRLLGEPTYNVLLWHTERL